MRRASRQSKCPVTRGSHDWLDLSTHGGGENYQCSECHAEAISVEEEEWELFKNGYSTFIDLGDDEGKWYERDD